MIEFKTGRGFTKGLSELKQAIATFQVSVLSEQLGQKVDSWHDWFVDWSMHITPLDETELLICPFQLKYNQVLLYKKP